MIKAFWVYSVKSELPNFTNMVVPGWVSINWSDCKVSQVMIKVIEMYAYCGFFIQGIVVLNIVSVVIKADFKGKAGFSHLLEGAQFTSD